MKIVLNPATDADFDYSRKIHRLAYLKMVIRQFGEWDDSVAERFFTESWNRLPHSIILADRQPVGYCCIESQDDTLQVREFAIDPAHQGKGIGTQILKDLLDQGEAEKKLVLINAMKTNTEAKRLYEKLGFAVYGENDFQYLLKKDFSKESARKN